MTNHTQSKAAHPWEAPGFTFSIGWPAGYDAAQAPAVQPAEVERRAPGRPPGTRRGTEWAKGRPSAFSAPAEKKRAPVASDRNAARESGAHLYRTGKPCLRGHLADRYTSKASCVECVALAKAKRKEASRKPRGAARKAGAATYSTGKPCARGHVSPRRLNGTCLECDRERKAAITEARRESRAAAE